MKYYTARGPDPRQISIRRYATNYLRPTHGYEIFYHNDKSLLASLEFAEERIYFFFPVFFSLSGFSAIVCDARFVSGDLRLR